LFRFGSGCLFRFAASCYRGNASQQGRKSVEKINSLTQAEAGDLAFFANSAHHIVHVGILMNSHQIIHASGWVKIENIDEHGIISEQTGNYSHTLYSIKRMI
jgi:cell wall-associated NlpC family hydrolase